MIEEVFLLLLYMLMTCHKESFMRVQQEHGNDSVPGVPGGGACVKLFSRDEENYGVVIKVRITITADSMASNYFIAHMHTL